MASITLFCLLLNSCQASTPQTPPPAPAPTVVEAVMLPTPALPDDVFLQYFFPDSGETHRISLDGHYRKTDPGKPEVTLRPMNKGDLGKEALSKEALARLMEAARVLMTAGPDAGGSGKRRVVFSARLEGKVWESTAQVEPGKAASYGALAGLYRELDNRVLGGWMNE